MYRTLFEIGPFTVYSYGLLVAAGFLIAALLLFKDSEKAGLSRDAVFDCFLAILIGGIVGGRLLFALINWRYYINHPLGIFMLREGGMAFHGALGMAVLFGAVMAWIKKLPFWRAADLFAPYVALGHAVGRIGCYLNGCCYGRVITHGAGVTFPGEAFMRMPTQIYSVLFLLFLYVVLTELRQKHKFEGFVFCSYIVLYAFFRFFIGFLRGDNPSIFYGFTLSQMISVGMFVFGLALGGILWIRGRKMS